MKLLADFSGLEHAHGFQPEGQPESSSLSQKVVGTSVCIISINKKVVMIMIMYIVSTCLKLWFSLSW